MSFSSKNEVGYLSFAGGLVTEYNPLAAPEGVTADELNMDLDTEGMVRVVRPPLKQQAQVTINNYPADIVLVAAWEDIRRFLLVVQKRNTPTSAEYLIVISSDAGATMNTEAEFPVSFNTVITGLPSITFARKRAILTLGGNVLVLQREASGSFSMFGINILIRDFKLIDDALRISQRPLTLSNLHKYNLLNAGWYQNRKRKTGSTVGDPIEYFFARRTEYPSNADVAYLGDVTNSNGDLEFDPASYDNIDTGSTEAPRGHYIFNIKNINRASKLSDKLNDGSGLPSVVVVDDGNDPDTGLPPDPTEPWIPPDPGFCIPGEPCNEIP